MIRIILSLFLSMSEFRYRCPRGIDWLAYQQECEDAFRLECSEEDIKCDEDARRLYKYLKRQRTYIRRIDRISCKIYNGEV